MGDLGINKLSYLRQMQQTNAENSGKVTEENKNESEETSSKLSEENDTAGVLEIEEEETHETKATVARSKTSIKTAFKKLFAKAESTKTTNADGTIKAHTAMSRATKKPGDPPNLDEMRIIKNNLEALGTVFEARHDNAKTLYDFIKDKIAGGEEPTIEDFKIALSIITASDSACNTELKIADGDNAEEILAKEQAYSDDVTGQLNSYLDGLVNDPAAYTEGTQIINDCGKLGKDNTLLNSVFTSADKIREYKIEIKALYDMSKKKKELNDYYTLIKQQADRVHEKYIDAKDTLTELQAKIDGGTGITEAERNAAREKIEQYLDYEQPLYDGDGTGLISKDNDKSPYNQLNNLVDKEGWEDLQADILAMLNKVNPLTDRNGALDAPNIDTNLKEMNGILEIIKALPVGPSDIDIDWESGLALDKAGEKVLDTAKKYNDISTVDGQISGFVTGIDKVVTTETEFKTLVTDIKEKADALKAAEEDVTTKYNAYKAAASKGTQELQDLKSVGMDKVTLDTGKTSTPIDITALQNAAQTLEDKAKALDTFFTSTNKTLGNLNTGRTNLLNAMSTINGISADGTNGLTKTETVTETVTKTTSLSGLNTLKNKIQPITVTTSAGKRVTLQPDNIVEWIIEQNGYKTAGSSYPNFKISGNTLTYRPSATGNVYTATLTSAQLSSITNFSDAVTGSGTAKAIKAQRTAITNVFKSSAPTSNISIRNNLGTTNGGTTIGGETVKNATQIADAVKKVTSFDDYVKSGGNLTVMKNQGIQSYLSTIPSTNLSYKTTTTTTKTVINKTVVTKYNEAVKKYNEAIDLLKSNGVASSKLPSKLTELADNATPDKAKSALKTAQDTSHAGKDKGTVNTGVSDASTKAYKDFVAKETEYDNAAKAYNTELKNVKNKGAKTSLPNEAKQFTRHWSYKTIKDADGNSITEYISISAQDGTPSVSELKSAASTINGSKSGGVKYSNFINNLPKTPVDTGKLTKASADEWNTKAADYNSKLTALKNALGKDVISGLSKDLQSKLNTKLPTNYSTSTKKTDAQKYLNTAVAVLTSKELEDTVGDGGKKELQDLLSAIKSFNEKVDPYNTSRQNLLDKGNDEVDALVPEKAKKFVSETTVPKESELNSIRTNVTNIKTGAHAQALDDAIAAQVEELKKTTVEEIETKYPDLLTEYTALTGKDVPTYEELKGKTPSEIKAIVDGMKKEAEEAKSNAYKAYESAITDYNKKRDDFVSNTGITCPKMTANKDGKTAVNDAKVNVSFVKISVYGKSDAFYDENDKKVYKINLDTGVIDKTVEHNWSDDSVYGKYYNAHKAA